MTVAELIEEVRRLLFTGQREERNKLSVAIDADDITATLIYAMGGVQKGAKLSIDLEDMYVWDIASQVATIERGQFGSTAAAHLINSVVHVNPKFSNYEIFKAINTEIGVLSSPVNGLYEVVTTQLTYNPVVHAYDYPTNAMDILEVRYEIPGPSQDWILSSDWEVSNDVSTSDFASGRALFIHDAYPNYNVMVKAKVGFTQMVASMAATVPDLPPDLLATAAAWRLTAPREVRRNFDEVQGDTRRAAEVPPGANLGGSRELARIRQERIREEAARLQQQHPPRKRRYPYQASYS